MKLGRGLLLGASILISVLAFQNCGKSSQDLMFSDHASKSAVSGDNGNHYDGKLYVLVGDVCSDGTQIRAKIQLTSSTSGQLLRDNCQDITPVLLSSIDFQINVSDANELVYKSQTFVAEFIGAGFGVLPKLSNTVDPTGYGAKGDGVSDNTAAFAAALAAGDLLIPAGTYLVSGNVRVPPGRNIQCASLSSVKIVNSVTAAKGNQATFQFSGQGGSVSNCRMSGTDVFNANGTAVFDQNFQYNYLIAVVDYYGGPVGKVKITNNIFENCHGNSCVTFYGGTTNVDGNQVSYNTFRNCGYLGVVIDGGTNNTVSQNKLTDCSLSVQNDNLTQANFNNIFEDNTLTAVRGSGKGAPYITGGSTGNFAADYTSNIVRNNRVIGNGATSSINILMTAPKPAQYSGNTCTNGCVLN